MTRRPARGYQRRGYWYFKYKKEDGTWAEFATGKKDYGQAQSRYAAFLNEQEAGRLPNERAEWTLEQATMSRLEERKWRVAQGTHSSERSIVRTILRVLGAKTLLRQVADIQVVKRYETTRLREGMSRKTVNNEVLVIAGTLRDANLWHRVVSYEPLKVSRSDVGDALTKDEASKLIQIALAAKPNAVAPYAAVLSYSTALRTAEIKQLRRGSIHIDAEKPFLQVRRSSTKTDQGARYVALDRMARWALVKLLARADRLGALQPDHFLLPTLRSKHTRRTDPLNGGTGYDPTHCQSSWDKEWKELRRSAGTLHRRFHDLRHSYITRAAEAGVPLPVTQAQVGHMSTQMIAHYTHICQGAIHKAAELIEKNSAELLVHFNFSNDGEISSLATKEP